MSKPIFMEHNHQPLYRVVRRDCADPLDISASRRKFGDHRWNTPEFPALYCCCSEWVARAVALDRFRLAGVDLTDLQPMARPQLVELSWAGKLVDAVSQEGVAAAGFPPEYPEGVRKEQTRRAATEWHSTGAAGVVCRCASLQRRGFANWAGSHQRWSEAAIYVRENEPRPSLIRRREDLDWL